MEEHIQLCQILWEQLERLLFSSGVSLLSHMTKKSRKSSHVVSSMFWQFCFIEGEISLQINKINMFEVILTTTRGVTRRWTWCRTMSPPLMSHSLLTLLITASLHWYRPRLTHTHTHTHPCLSKLQFISKLSLNQHVREPDSSQQTEKVSDQVESDITSHWRRAGRWRSEELEVYHHHHGRRQTGPLRTPGGWRRNHTDFIYTEIRQSVFNMVNRDQSRQKIKRRK